MIMAEIGFILKVAGSKIEIAPIGPIPGRTPTNVPNNTPKKQKKTFVG